MRLNCESVGQLTAESDATITESGRTIAGHSEIVSTDLIGERPSFEIGAGQYEFEVQ